MGSGRFPSYNTVRALDLVLPDIRPADAQRFVRLQRSLQMTTDGSKRSADVLISRGTADQQAARDAVGNQSFDVCFLLLEGYSLISFASAIEPLRLANKVIGRTVFRHRCYSADGADAPASNGMMMRVDGPVSAMTQADLLVVCSSDGVERLNLTADTRAAIRTFAHRGSRVAGICTGAYVLASLGLLRDRGCTIHWEYAEMFRELFLETELHPSLVHVDDKVMTCAGGTSAFELMVHFIEDVCDLSVGRAVADIALHHELRVGSSSQRSDPARRLGITNAHLSRCIELMEGNIENPLTSIEIAEQLGISWRHIGRLFQRYLGDTPQNYYRKIRLEVARHLIRRSDLPIIEVVFASGFVNSAHFTRSYRETFGVSPARDQTRRDALAKLLVEQASDFNVSIDGSFRLFDRILADCNQTSG